tara:strand:- start:4761 stop:5975 length:1215 start_codon:yes stop_codon:yes gene_type:complete
MANIEITTMPTGRSPENKIFYGSKTRNLDLSRPKYNKIGEEKYFWEFYEDLNEYEHEWVLVFYTSGLCFRVETNDDRHAQFVKNMFKVEEDPYNHTADWTIIHNTEIKVPPSIAVHLDEQVMLIGGTTFLGEIKKGVFSILGFTLPESGILPMHCAAFTYENTTNLMFGLSGTGKTTLSSDPDFMLISDDEVSWNDKGIKKIEEGCYAKSEGLSPETHPTIFNAVEEAKKRETLVVENPKAANARLSYPLDCVLNAWIEQEDFAHPNNIFFLTMDATGSFPAVSKISGETVRRFFETGYTSQMPGTEAGVSEIKKTFSPCYGSPFMPRKIQEYSDMLMEKIDKHNANVYLVNTGMDKDGKRFKLDFTRNCIKHVMSNELHDTSEEVLEILENLLIENNSGPMSA